MTRPLGMMTAGMADEDLTEAVAMAVAEEVTEEEAADTVAAAEEQEGEDSAGGGSYDSIVFDRAYLARRWWILPSWAMPAPA